MEQDTERKNFVPCARYRQNAVLPLTILQGSPLRRRCQHDLLTIIPFGGNYFEITDVCRRSGRLNSHCGDPLGLSAPVFCTARPFLDCAHCEAVSPISQQDGARLSPVGKADGRPCIPFDGAPPCPLDLSSTRRSEVDVGAAGATFGRKRSDPSAWKSSAAGLSISSTRRPGSWLLGRLPMVPGRSQRNEGTMVLMYRNDTVFQWYLPVL